MSEKCMELVSPDWGLHSDQGRNRENRPRRDQVATACLPPSTRPPSGQRVDFALGWQFSTKGNFAYPPYSPVDTWQYLKTFLAVTRVGWVGRGGVLQRPRKLRNPLPCAGATRGGCGPLRVCQ